MPRIRPCQKALLIRCQRRAKSASCSGRVQIPCRWSGKITAASIVKGCRAPPGETPPAIGQYDRSQSDPAIGQVDREEISPMVCHPSLSRLIRWVSPRGWARIGMKGCRTGLRPSRRRLRQLLRMRVGLDGIKKIPHPEEAATAAVSKDARCRSGRWQFLAQPPRSTHPTR